MIDDNPAITAIEWNWNTVLSLVYKSYYWLQILKERERLLSVESTLCCLHNDLTRK